MNWQRVGPVVVACLLPIGCGGIKYGEVSGKVTYKGKPLPGGTVTFWSQSAGRSPVAAPLDAEGAYSATVPTGEVAVTVETESVSGRIQTGIPGGMFTDKSGRQRPGGPPPEIMAQIKKSTEQTGTTPVAPERGDYVKIDPKYSQPNKSGLKLNVQTGKQEFNIPLQ